VCHAAVSLHNSVYEGHIWICCVKDADKDGGPTFRLVLHPLIMAAAYIPLLQLTVHTQSADNTSFVVTVSKGIR
jgi:hypothetical protein